MTAPSLYAHMGAQLNGGCLLMTKREQKLEQLRVAFTNRDYNAAVRIHIENNISHAVFKEYERKYLPALGGLK